jgi:hypothetical protein
MHWEISGIKETRDDKDKKDSRTSSCSGSNDEEETSKPCGINSRSTRSQKRRSSELCANAEKNTKASHGCQLSSCSTSQNYQLDVSKCESDQCSGREIVADKDRDVQYGEFSDSTKTDLRESKRTNEDEADAVDLHPAIANPEKRAPIRQSQRRRSHVEKYYVDRHSMDSSVVEGLELVRIGVKEVIGSLTAEKGSEEITSLNSREDQRKQIPRKRSAKRKRSEETRNASRKAPFGVAGSYVIDLEIIDPRALQDLKSETQLSSAIGPGALLKVDSRECAAGNGCNLRRSRRSSIRPERLGAYANKQLCEGNDNKISMSCGNKKKIQSEASTSELKMKASPDTPPRASKRRRKSEEGVRASAQIQANATSCDNHRRLSLDSTDDDNHWSEEEVILLREAQKEIDPKSVSFWEEVSDMVEARSSVECRGKWFSLVKTPVIRTRKPRKQPSADLIPTSSDDDIFNATPMKALFSAENAGEPTALFENIVNLSNFSFGSAIKVGNNSNRSSGRPENQTQRGYKTYIKAMKRGVNKTSKGRPPKAIVNKSKSAKNLAESAGEGDVEMRCRLSPNGTLRLKTNEYRDGDNDYLDYEDEIDVDDASRAY